MSEKDLSPSDFEILKILWRQHTLGAKEIHDQLAKKFEWSYSTSRTVLERMVKKGLVVKTESHGLNVYSAAVSRVRTVGRMVQQFAENVLETDPRSVAALFGESSAFTREEIQELSQLFHKKIGSSRHKRSEK